MIRIAAIDHLVLRTERVEDMVEFYCEVLGCTLERRLVELGLIQLRAGPSLIDIVDVNAELGRRGGAAQDRRFAALLAENLRRYQAGEPLKNLVDPRTGRADVND